MATLISFLAGGPDFLGLQSRRPPLFSGRTKRSFLFRCWIIPGFEKKIRSRKSGQQINWICVTWAGRNGIEGWSWSEPRVFELWASMGDEIWAQTMTQSFLYNHNLYTNIQERTQDDTARIIFLPPVATGIRTRVSRVAPIRDLCRMLCRLCYRTMAITKPHKKLRYRVAKLKFW